MVDIPAQAAAEQAYVRTLGKMQLVRLESVACSLLA